MYIFQPSNFLLLYGRQQNLKDALNQIVDNEDYLIFNDGTIEETSYLGIYMNTNIEIPITYSFNNTNEALQKTVDCSFI